MELRQLKARLALLDSMMMKMNASPARLQQIKRTVFVLRAILSESGEIPSVYGPNLSIAPFSLQ
jgi:hypothetical protein